jgi:hypothetical protein
LPLITDFIGDLHQWVSVRCVHKWQDSEELFLEKFRQHLRLVLAMLMKRPLDKTPLSIEEFLLDPNKYCSTGALLVNGPVIPPRKTVKFVARDTSEVLRSKWVLPFTVSRDTLHKAMLTPITPTYKAIMKQEADKVRAVISSPIELHLMMSYISHVLDYVWNGSSILSMYNSPSKLIDFWFDVFHKQGVNSSIWKLPLDYSTFDHQVNLQMIDVFLSEITSLLKYLLPTWDEGLAVMDVLTRSLLQGGVVIIGDHKIDIKNGLLSGWRWTSMMGSVVNATFMSMSSELISRPLMVEYMRIQGDDVHELEREFIDCIRRIKALNSMNITVHPSKTYASTLRNEYLRKTIVGNPQNAVVQGYPARFVNSVIRMKPTTKKEYVSIRERLTTWLGFFARIRVNPIIEDMYRDFSNLGYSHYLEWLTTPASIGGGGMWPLNGGYSVRRVEAKYNVKVEGISHLTQWAHHNLSRSTIVKGFYTYPFREDVVAVANPLHNEDFSLEPITWEVLRISPKLPAPRIRWGAVMFMLQERILTMMRDKTNNLLLTVYEDATVSFARKLEKIGSRRAAIGWLLGDLSGAPPAHLGVSPSLTSYVYDKYRSIILNKLYVTGFTNAQLIRAVCQAEVLTLKHLALFGSPVREL